VIALIGAAGEDIPTGAAPSPGAASSSDSPDPHATQQMAIPVEVAATAKGVAAPLEQQVRIASSPVVRRIAKEEGVDLHQVTGTGIHGRITKRDILQYLDAGGAAVSGTEVATPPPPPAPAPSTAAVPPGLEFSVPAWTEGERVTLEPMSRIRKLTAGHMLYSQQTSAHVATVFDVDLSSVVAARAMAKDRFAAQVGTKLTYMPFFFKAVAKGLQTFPKFNASLSGTDIVYKQDVNLGMAVALDWGLIVPVIHQADRLNLVGLAQAANDLADRARTKKLKPEEVQGGTFTITNPGVFGSLFGTPLINQPQVAILCLGAIEKRAVVVSDEFGNDAIAIRPMAYLCLSYDHRLIDGSDAEQFMVHVKQTLTGDPWSELDPYR
jgi:pyruvate dehydrogenase E2 component (dihydrolipoamide acetyltransferase)